MQVSADKLPDNIQKLVNAGVKGTDIMHGEIKLRLYEAEAKYVEAQRIEEENGYSDAMESMERKYWEGYVDALIDLYGLTYDISFAEGENRKEEYL